MEAPEKAVLQILRGLVREDGVDITSLRVAPMQHDGWFAEIFKAEIAWKARDGVDSRIWILKHWRRSSAWWAFCFSPIEALAWEHGLIRGEALPEGLRVPYVGVARSEENADGWIAMEDVSPELDAFRHPASRQQNLEAARAIIDRVACFHVRWERSDRMRILEQYPWLLKQEPRLQIFTDANGEVLRGKPRTLQSEEDFDFARKFFKSFFDWLPAPDRQLWEDHLCDSTALTRMMADLPVSLLHGDLDKRNIGLRRKGDTAEVFLIDWEWSGIGSPAFDVVQLINAVDNVGGVPDGTPRLSDYYYERYLAHGGSRMSDALWEKAYDLSFISEGLKLLPYQVGGLALGILRDFDVSTATIGKSKVERVTEAMRKWLR